MESKYQKGKIYKLTCDDVNLVYYGSTIKKLQDRLGNHKAPSNATVSRTMRDIGGLKIELVEEYPCNSRRELEQREQYYIDNNECINFKPAFITKEQKEERNKEYKKEYQKANRDKINQKLKEYQKANKEKLKEKRKQYYEANKEKIKEKMREYWHANRKIDKVKTI